MKRDHVLQAPPERPTIQSSQLAYIPQFEAFAQACRKAGNDESKFHALLRTWINQPEDQRTVWLAALKSAAALTPRFLAELQIRLERLDILARGTPLEHLTLYKFRRALVADPSINRSDFDKYIDTTFVGRKLHFSVGKHMLALVQDYPFHPNFTIAMARRTRDCDALCLREIRDTLRSTNDYAVIETLVASSPQLSAEDAVRDLRALADWTRNRVLITDTQRSELYGKIITELDRLHSKLPSLPVHRLLKDVLKLKVALCATIDPTPALISELRLELEIADQRRRTHA